MPKRDMWTSPDPPRRVSQPMIFQAWRDVAFLHWPFDPEVVRPLIPSAFDVDTFRGKAWVSLISFSIPAMRARGLPPVPGLSSAAETHIRTYVRGPEGTRGVWFFSLDIDPLPAAILGRGLFLLPYWWARMSVSRDGDEVEYDLRRRSGKSGRFQLALELGSAYRPSDLRPLDHFLTARWALYLGVGPVRATALVEHPRWRFRRASVARLTQDLTVAQGLPTLDVAPVVHFSDGVDARIGVPRPFLARSGG